MTARHSGVLMSMAEGQRLQSVMTLVTTSRNGLWLGLPQRGHMTVTVVV